VLLREVRWWFRLRSLRRKKGAFWLVCLGVVLIGWFYLQGLLAFNGTTQDAAHMWVDCLFVELGLIAILSPLVAASAISQERERQTWETVQTTPLTGGQIFLGKWLARQAPMALMLLILLPPVLGCAFVGDVALPATFFVYILLLLTSAGFGIVGLFCSFLTRRTTTAVTLSLVIMAIVCIGPYLLVDFLSMMGFLWGAGSEDRYHNILSVSPLFVVYTSFHWLKPEGLPSFVSSDFLKYPFRILSQYVCSVGAVIVFCFVFMTNRYRKAALSS